MITAPQNRSIPRTLHLIWVGDDLPINYFKALNNAQQACQNAHYTLNVWMDSSAREANGKELAEMQATEGFIVRETGEILDYIATTPSFTEDEKTQLLKALAFEYMSPPNYGAVSDFLRLLILYKEGGIYADFDIIPENFASIHLEESLPFTELSDIGIAHPDRTNNLILSASEHPALRHCLQSMTHQMFGQHTCPENEYADIAQDFFLTQGENVSDEGLKILQNFIFKDNQAWWLAKKSTVIPPPEKIIRNYRRQSEPYHTSMMFYGALCGLDDYFPPMRALTIGIGPGALSESLLPYEQDAETVHAVETKLRQTFNVDKYDMTWLSDKELTSSEERAILKESETAVSVFFESIHDFTLGKLVNTFSPAWDMRRTVQDMQGQSPSPTTHTEYVELSRRRID